MLPQARAEAPAATLGRVLRSPPLGLMLAAGPDAPGAAALLARARCEAREGRELRILLSGDGLAWAADPRLAAADSGADVAVCSRNARVAGWTADTTPAGVRWSSVATWLAELPSARPGSLWAALP